MSLLRLAQVGTVKSLPWLQKGARLLGNEKVRGGLGFGLGAMTSDGGLGNRLKGGLIGGLVGATPLPGQNWAMAKSGAALSRLGMNPHLAQNLAQVGVPLAGIGLLSRQGGGDVTPEVASAASNIAANTGQNVVGAGAHLLNQQGVGPYQDPLGGLPAGTVARMVGPDGGIWYQLAPGGQGSAQRLGRVLGAQADASVINTLGNALYGQTERVAKAELERQAAAEQLKANIDMAKQMSLHSQQAGLNIAQNAGVAMGNAMSQRNMFRYF